MARSLNDPSEALYDAAFAGDITKMREVIAPLGKGARQGAVTGAIARAVAGLNAVTKDATASAVYEAGQDAAAHTDALNRLYDLRDALRSS